MATRTTKESAGKSKSAKPAAPAHKGEAHDGSKHDHAPPKKGTTLAEDSAPAHVAVKAHAEAAGKRAPEKAQPAKDVEAPAPTDGHAKTEAAAAGPDVSGADAAYARLEPRIKAMTDDELVRPNVDAQQAAMSALSTADRLEDPARKALVASLAKLGLANLGLIEGLRDAALATWHARHELLEASATDSRAVLPAELRAQAIDCRKRMRGVLEYNVRDAATLDVLKFLRSGRGDLDLANDLVGYAKLYRDRRVDLERDKVNYRANDEALAKRLAGDIGKRLGGAETPASRAWARAQAGAFALLVECHGEAGRVGRFIEHDEAAAVYPSLYVPPRGATPRRHDATTKPSTTTPAAP